MVGNLTKSQPLWLAQELHQACGGMAYDLKPCHGVSIDSRTLAPGDLFVAIKGPVVDGHDYVDHALSKGAAGIIITQDQPEWQLLPRLIVKDSEQALRDLAQFSRARTQATIYGITGSFGKTSIKDALTVLLSQQCDDITSTQRSFNNHWGVPLTLSRLHAQDQYGVFEMGMNHTGEMTGLSQLVRPNIALINNVGSAHQGNFTDINAVGLAKAEIFTGMAPHSTVILNQDFGPYDLLYQTAQDHNLNVLSFSCMNPQADFYLQQVDITDQGQKLEVKTPQGVITVALSIIAATWQANTLALLALLHAGGLNLHATQFDFKTLRQSPGRGQIHHITTDQGNLVVIDESYNAAPDSMKAALKNVAHFPGNAQTKRIAILGDMLELGALEQQIHHDLADFISPLNIDQVHCCGKLMASLHPVLKPSQQGKWALTPPEIWDQIAGDFKGDIIVMVKGSRGQRAYDGRMAFFVNQLLNLKKP